MADNNEQFVKIYKDNVDIIYRYTYARLYKKEEAEDVTSKTFTIAYEKILAGKYQDESKDKAWLIQIARNVMGNQFRKKSNQEASLAEDYHIPDFKDSIADITITQSQVSEVKECFKTLNAETREVLSLRIWEEYKFKEIAEVMNISEDNAKKRYQRGLSKIKKTLKDKEDKRYFAIAFVGVQSLARDSLFIPTAGFVKTTIAGIGAGLSKLFLQASGTKMITLFGKTIAAKTLTVGVTTAVGVTAIGGGAYYYQTEMKDDNEKKEEKVEEKNDTEEIVIVDEKEFDFSNWEKYTNEAGGYSIMYPKEWEQANPGDIVDSEDDAKSTFFGRYYTNAFGEINEENGYGKYFTGGQVFWGSYMSEDTSRFNYEDVKEVEVDGEKVMMVNNYHDGQHRLSVFFERNSVNYEISTYDIDKKLMFSTRDIEVLEQLAYSFKLEEKEVVTIEEEPIDINSEDGKFIGHIKNAYLEDEKYYIDIDYIQFLDGKEAIVAALDDKDCVLYEKGTFNELDLSTELPKVENMVLEEINETYDHHCAPNDFYIRNQNPKIRTFEVTVDTYKTATDFENDPDGIRDIGFPEFAGYLMDYQLYNIEVKEGKVIKVEEQYIP